MTFSVLEDHFPIANLFMCDSLCCICGASHGPFCICRAFCITKCTILLNIRQWEWKWQLSYTSMLHASSVTLLH